MLVANGGTREVAVGSDASLGEVRLEARDNGRGIDPQDLSKRTSFGVRGMRERVRDLGGALEIASMPQGGTHLSLRLPLRLAAEAEGA